jgi:hypothetical protein
MPHVSARDTAQLLVHEGQQAIEGRSVTLAPGLKQRRGVVRAAVNGPILHPHLAASLSRSFDF